MDIQLCDENGKSCAVMQHDELELVLQYAEKWSQISNDQPKNWLVLGIIMAATKAIERMKKNKEWG